ncbi:Serine/threonine-protein kinase stk11 [Entophlyctis luteolus]|nr:Serine/threonine-protein kinase stk11 [Entophlyctis luteolus]
MSSPRSSAPQKAFRGTADSRVGAASSPMMPTDPTSRSPHAASRSVSVRSDTTGAAEGKVQLPGPTTPRMSVPTMTSAPVKFGDAAGVDATPGPGGGDGVDARATAVAHDRAAVASKPHGVISRHSSARIVASSSPTPRAQSYYRANTTTGKLKAPRETRGEQASAAVDSHNEDDGVIANHDSKRQTHTSTVSLAKKKISQQGNSARVLATLRKSMGDGLYQASGLQSLRDTNPNPLRGSQTGSGATGSVIMAAYQASRRQSNTTGNEQTRQSSTSRKFDICEKPQIHMFPRKSIGSSLAQSPSIHNYMQSILPDTENFPGDSINANQPHFRMSSLTGPPDRREDCPVVPLKGILQEDNPEYYDYVMLSQRHASSNFITKIGSGEIDYGTQKTVVKVIGPYIMGNQIGKGAYGKVKEGICSQTLQRVAIKIINKKRLRKIPNGVEHALSEIKLLRKLKHPNVVTLVDVYCKVEDDEGNYGIFNWFSTIEDEPIAWTYDDGTVLQKNVVVLKWYLVFEYCPCSLQTLIEQSEAKKLTFADAHRYFVQLIEGLAYLHSQSIVHRDIKAGNLLITPDGVIKISDFGVAEQFCMYDSGAMISEMFAGTHQFMAPELCEGQAKLDAAKLDLWACGVTLYNMVTGKYPFEFPEDGNLLGLYDIIVAGKFDIPSWIEADLADMLRALLAHDTNTRASIAQVRQHPWWRGGYAGGSGSGTTQRTAAIMSYPSSNFQTQDTGVATLARVPTARKHDAVAAGNHEVMRLRAVAKKLKYQSIVSLHQKQTPCETTMIPFLVELCGRDIEESLATTKRFIDIVGGQDAFGSASSVARRGTSSSTSNGLSSSSHSVKCRNDSKFQSQVYSEQGKSSFKQFFRSLFNSKIKPQ